MLEAEDLTFADADSVINAGESQPRSAKNQINNDCAIDDEDSKGSMDSFNNVDDTNKQEREGSPTLTTPEKKMKE